MPERLPRFRSPAAQSRYYATYDRILRLWPVPYEERYIHTRFGKTHVLVSGPADAPPLVCLHGINATALMWMFSIAELSQHYRCYCVDTISDVGRSVCTAPIKTTGDLVGWFTDLLDGLGLDRVRVAGMSHGGWIAALTALQVPGRISKAVVMAPPGTFVKVPLQFVLRALPALVTRSEASIRWLLKWTFSRKELVSHPWTDLVVAAMQTFSYPLDALMPVVFTDEELRSISVPVTVLIGEHETQCVGGPQAALKRAALMPGATTHLVPNAGHPMVMENPEQTHQWLLEGLA